MRIIDAHIHYRPQDIYFDAIAEHAGHQNTEAHLLETFDSLGISMGLVMGNRGLELENHIYPPHLKYLVGLDSSVFHADTQAMSIDYVRRHLMRRECVGIKIYAGYTHYYLTDALYQPFYELAREFRKPVAIHTGVTANAQALLKYSHPLLMDEIAVAYPDVQFVMCHFGNPWLNDAAAVVEKNPNVAVDLSGILEGNVVLSDYLAHNGGYVEQLKTWIAYVEDYSRFMYGTDWPLANMESYIAFIRHIIPNEYHHQVFFENANRIYGLGLS